MTFVRKDIILLVFLMPSLISNTHLTYAETNIFIKKSNNRKHMPKKKKFSDIFFF